MERPDIAAEAVCETVIKSCSESERSSVPGITSVYEAVPLSSSKTSIRLLEILLDDDSSNERLEDPIISCSLFATDLDEKPKYTALSYMWGDATTTKAILVNGQRVEIRENLWDFLHRMREVKQEHSGPDAPSHTRYTVLWAYSLPLWIDAICIDQSLIPERNHQVLIMDIIFSSAHVTISWLGRGNEGLYKGMQFVEALEYKSQELQRPISNDVLPDLSLLYDHPYWNRVWIIQEVLLPRKLEIWCGKATLDENRALLGAKIFYDNANGLHSDNSFFLLGRRLRETCEDDPLRRSIVAESYLLTLSSFEVALFNMQTITCSDVRDRVYAILSLLDPEDRTRLDIKPDYAKTRDELFLEVSAKIWTNLVQYDRKAFNAYYNRLGFALDIPIITLDVDKFLDMHPEPRGP